MSYRIINGQMYYVGNVEQGSTLQGKINQLKPQGNSSKKFSDVLKETVNKNEGFFNFLHILICKINLI